MTTGGQHIGGRVSRGAQPKRARRDQVKWERLLTPAPNAISLIERIRIEGLNQVTHLINMIAVAFATLFMHH
jgi:hypothetical protein